MRSDLLPKRPAPARQESARHSRRHAANPWADASSEIRHSPYHEATETPPRRRSTKENSWMEFQTRRRFEEAKLSRRWRSRRTAGRQRRSGVCGRRCRGLEASKYLQLSFCHGPIRWRSGPVAVPDQLEMARQISKRRLLVRMQIEEPQRFSRCARAIASKQPEIFESRDGRPIRTVNRFAVIASFGCRQRVTRPRTRIARRRRRGRRQFVHRHAPRNHAKYPIRNPQERERDHNPGQKIAGLGVHVEEFQ